MKSPSQFVKPKCMCWRVAEGISTQKMDMNSPVHGMETGTEGEENDR